MNGLMGPLVSAGPLGFRLLSLMDNTSMCLFLYNRYKASPEDLLLKAFQVLDAENKGYLTQEELKKYMTEEGKY